MAAHPWVKRCPALVPIVGASYTLQDALWALLAGWGWERMGWDARRRGGAAARRAFGTALCSIATAGRWDSEAEADRYASPPPGWKFFLPHDVPWPAAGFACRIAPVHAYQVWPLGALGPQAPAGQEGGASDGCPGNSHDEGPGVCPGANVHEPIILGSTDDKSPDTVARRAARQPKSVCRRGRGASAPVAQRPGTQLASIARRPRTSITPAYTRGTQATAAGAPGRPRPAGGGMPGDSQVRAVRPRLERPS